jgi:hypothetical protein
MASIACACHPPVEVEDLLGGEAVAQGRELPTGVTHQDPTGEAPSPLHHEQAQAKGC